MMMKKNKYRKPNYSEAIPIIEVKCCGNCLHWMDDDHSCFSCGISKVGICSARTIHFEHASREIETGFNSVCYEHTPLIDITNEKAGDDDQEGK